MEFYDNRLDFSMILKVIAKFNINFTLNNEDKFNAYFYTSSKL